VQAMSTTSRVEHSLDEHLCLALHRASRAMTACYRPLLAEVGLTYPQYLVMALLWERGATSIGAIGERLGLESSTVSPLVKRLEAADLVQRRRGTADERTVEVVLTDAGEEMRERARHVPSRVAATTGLTAAERADLVERLRRLTDLLDPPG
jgi:DNA-binding MarR family transcriptional regulator